MLKLGAFDRERKEFWRFFSKALVPHQRYACRILRLAAMGCHFRKLNRAYGDYVPIKKSLGRSRRCYRLPPSPVDDNASLDPLAPNPEVANQLAKGTKEEQQTETNLKNGKCQNDNGRNATPFISPNCGPCRTT